MTAQWLPKGFHTITPNIIVNDAEQAVAFFKQAFGASETYRLTMSNGKIAHCELRLGDSIFNLGTRTRRANLRARLGCFVPPRGAGWGNGHHADDGHVLRFTRGARRGSLRQRVDHCNPSRGSRSR